MTRFWGFLSPFTITLMLMQRSFVCLMSQFDENDPFDHRRSQVILAAQLDKLEQVCDILCDRL